MKAKRRNQGEARKVARDEYPYPGCCLCGQTVGEQVCHLNHDSGDNAPKNLVLLCHHHHWMFDIGLFSLRALKLQRKHWQAVKGKATNPFMKDAGKKAAATRAAKRRSEIARKAVASRRARKAVATRRANAKAKT